MNRKLTPGTLSQYSGIDSNKQGLIVDRNSVRTRGDGIPLDIHGDYSKID